MPRLLSEKSLDRIPSEELGKYLVNEDIGKGIKIFEPVIRTLTKFSSSQEIPGMASDILALAIMYRSTFDITSEFEQWRRDIRYNYPYPACEANTIFNKYLKSCLLSPLFNGYFTENEVKKLIEFFAKCPHGYKFHRNYIFAHSEYSVIT